MVAPFGQDGWGLGEPGFALVQVPRPGLEVGRLRPPERDRVGRGRLAGLQRGLRQERREFVEFGHGTGYFRCESNSTLEPAELAQPNTLFRHQPC